MFKYHILNIVRIWFKFLIALFVSHSHLLTKASSFHSNNQGQGTNVAHALVSNGCDVSVMCVCSIEWLVPEVTGWTEGADIHSLVTSTASITLLHVRYSLHVYVCTDVY